MADSIAISFVDDHNESLAVYFSWGGRWRLVLAHAYLRELREDRSVKDGPLARLDPGAVLVDFLREVTHDLERVDGGIYLATVDNPYGPDHGHHKLHTKRTDGAVCTVAHWDNDATCGCLLEFCPRCSTHCVERQRQLEEEARRKGRDTWE